jgi:DNA-binding response OmpR family regulator
MKTILVIDDDQDFREMIRYVLSQEGFRVLAAADGRQGVLEIKRERPDLILMDMVMPGHDGKETATYLQAIGRFSGIPVVFLTGTVVADRPEGDGVINIEGQSYPVILKTVGREGLVRRVKQYLAGMNHKVLRVLLAEDSPTDAHLIARALQKSSRCHFEMHHVSTMSAERQYLQMHPVDVIVQDLALPDSNKTDTLLWMLRQELPVVVITGDEDESSVSEAFCHGAQDYLVKGDFSEREVVRCVMYAVERQMMRKESSLYKLNLERLVQERVREIMEKSKS